MAVDLRFLREPAELRALAHPLRIRMLALLQSEGPATATTLAGVVGESTGATSYHLRQLARYGLIEEADGLGHARERWWRAAARRVNIDPAALEAEGSASAALIERVVQHDDAIVRRFLERRAEYSRPWRDAAVIANHVIYATPDELDALERKLHTLIAEYEREDPAERPSGAGRVYGVLRLLPWAAELDGRDGSPSGAV